jgi:hypothetical protein
MKDVESKKTKWPSEKRRRAVNRGPVELMNLVEWQFRHRPVALRNCRVLFENFCWGLYWRLERARRGR